MFLEAYMQPRPLPATPERKTHPIWTETEVPALPEVPRSPAFQTVPGACGAPAAGPLLVEEIELQPVAEERFCAQALDERVWADTHQRPALAAAMAELPVAEVQEISGSAVFACRDAVDIALPEVSECPPDDADLALFAEHFSRPLRFEVHTSASARRASDERCWISDVAHDEAEAGPTTPEAAVPADTPTPEAAPLPDWAQHLSEFDCQEVIELLPVNMATLAQAAA